MTVRFVLYTDKTVSQCLNAMHERIQAPGTATRPALNGWVEKGGKFSITLTSYVLRLFRRTTRLEALVERESGSTVIRGSVPDGVPPRGQMIILGAILLIGLLLLARGEVLMALVVVLAGGILYVPLHADYENSDRLLIEVERTLKADPKPPKRDAKKPSSSASAAAKKPIPAAKKPATPAKKPTATPAKKPVTAKK